MKTMRILVVLVLVTSSLTAQNGKGQPLSLKQMTLNEKSWMREAGFPITKYDFSKSNINEELSLGLKERKDAKLLSTLSWAGVGAGIVTMLVSGTSTKGGTGTYIAGGGLMVGGLVTNLFASSKKKKARKRIQNASFLFDDIK